MTPRDYVCAPRIEPDVGRPWTRQRVHTSVVSALLMLALGCHQPAGPSPMTRMAVGTLPEPAAPSPEPVPGATRSRLEFVSLEVEYDWDGTRSYYVPRAEVRETTGVASATITELVLTFPHGGHARLVTTKCIVKGSQRPVLGHVYGSDEWSVAAPDQAERTDQATLAITYRDPDGHEARIAATTQLAFTASIREANSSTVNFPCF